jgi:hypothetical protein
MCEGWARLRVWQRDASATVWFDRGVLREVRGHRRQAPEESEQTLGHCRGVFASSWLGAFFVSSGIQFYLYLADVSVPLLGTDFVQTPALSLARSIPHFALFLITLYFGFIRKPKA